MIEWKETDLALALLDPPQDAHRLTIDAERVAALADDIAGQGLLQRIGARGPSPDGRYEVVWGDRRSRAFRLLGRASIPARVCSWDTDPLHARTMENLGGEKLTPLEEARVCARYHERYQSIPAVARLVRHTPGWVEQRLALLAYPDELQTAVQDGDVSMAVAAHLARVDHDGYRGELIREAIRMGATAPVVITWVAHYEADRERLIHNHVTIEQLIAERATFVILQVCEGCAAQVPAAEIRPLHLCHPCMASIREAIAAEAATTPR